MFIYMHLLISRYVQINALQILALQIISCAVPSFPVAHRVGHPYLTLCSACGQMSEMAADSSVLWETGIGSVVDGS